MFKKAERSELGSIDSIPIDFGILYQLSFVEYPNPKEVIKEKMRFTQFSNVKLESFVVDSRALVKSSNLSILENMDKSLIYDMELAPSLANILMDKIDSIGIKLKESFYLKKIKTDNQYKPEIEVSK